jgi:hypothetical protein
VKNHFYEMSSKLTLKNRNRDSKHKIQTDKKKRYKKKSNASRQHEPTLPPGSRQAGGTS